MLLHLLLFGFCTAAAGKRLLEDYEQKLNRINSRLEWRRAPGKHRIKRYRCVEEYVDEHGNVIEEGASHYTTVPPSPSEIIYYDKARSAGRNTHSNSVVRGVASAMKRIKSAMVKKKAKTKGTKLHKKLPMDDDERRGMVRVYPITTPIPRTTPSPMLATTEAIDYNDDIIMRKYFPSEKSRSNNQLTTVNTNKGTIRVTTPTPALKQQQSSIRVDFMEIPSSSDDADSNADRASTKVPLLIRQPLASVYAPSPSADYEYTDYSYDDEDVIYYKMPLRMKKARRQYMGVPIRKYPSQRVLRPPRVPILPIPPHYTTDRSNRNTIRKMMGLSKLKKLKKMESLRPSAMEARPVLKSPPPLPLPPPPTITVEQPVTMVPPMQKAAGFEESTPQTCARMRRLAMTFGITDISSYARKNCLFLQAFAPGFSCEQISHFVDSCAKKALPKER